MIIYTFFTIISSIFSATITTIGNFFYLAMPGSIDSYWSAVSSIFSGIKVLDSFLPISELIVFATAGLALNLTLTVLVNGWSVGRMFLTLIFFWRK